MKLLISLLSILLFSESCNSVKANTMSPKNQEQQLLSGTYTVNLLEKNNSIPTTLTLTFEEESNKVSGFAGCNSFFGSYSVTNHNISFSQLAMTKKYCGDNSINNLESQFIKVLNQTKSFKIEGKTLSLLDKSASVVLKANKRDKLTSTTKSDIVGPNYKQSAVTYQAISRGTFEYINVSKSKISITTDKSLQQIQDYTCDAQDWIEIKALLDALNTKTFQQLKAPTDKRLFDGAAHATLSVKQGDVLLTTPSFDHGFPPKEIENLVNKVLSLAEKVKKK